ncbi:transporter substrate-binding domain-containing protein [Gynuella sp.]|uniref:transporter substrate-binding domain-containing protein n=1 Tax=Gynuella sp. TaxID=2969146 RepID=UPI003D0EEF2C
MKKILLTLSALLAMASYSHAEETIRIAVDVPYEPFEYKAPDGSLTGFEIELGNAVCAEMKVKCEWVIQAWDGIIPGLLAYKYDAILSSMSITTERAQKVAFTNGYYNTPTGWFAKKGSHFDPNDKASIKGKKIGAQRGTIQDKFATDNLKDADVVRYGTADELVIDLYNGRLDAVILDYPVGETTVLGGDQGSEYELIGKPFQLGDGAAVALRPSDKELVEKFNKALDVVKNNGVYDEIRKKYFSYDIKI